MDYEKKYKEALDRAKEFHKSKEGIYVLVAETIFPELRESEDERIRKKCIAIISKWTIKEDRDECITYLEKQKDQKPVENPKKGCPTYPLSVVGDLLAKTPQGPIVFVPDQKPVEWKPQSDSHGSERIAGKAGVVSLSQD